MKKRTTKIRVLGETWHVPRGFGAVYRRVLRAHLDLIAAGAPGPLISEVIDLLALVGYQATPEQVAAWDLRRRVEAVVYASNEYARASDNPLQVYPRPFWLLPRPWQGEVRGGGGISAPRGTPIMEGV